MLYPASDGSASERQDEIGLLARVAAAAGGSGLAVFAVLRALAGTGPEIRVGRRTLSNLSGCSVSTVKRALRRLEAEGLLQTRESIDSTGQRESAYRLTPPGHIEPGPGHSEPPPVQNALPRVTVNRGASVEPSVSGVTPRVNMNPPPVHCDPPYNEELQTCTTESVCLGSERDRRDSTTRDPSLRPSVSGRGEPADPTEKDLLTALADLTRDWDSHRNRVEALRYLTSEGATPRALAAFGPWWREKNPGFAKGPTPKQVVASWPEFMAWARERAAAKRREEAEQRRQLEWQMQVQREERESPRLTLAERQEQHRLQLEAEKQRRMVQQCRLPTEGLTFPMPPAEWTHYRDTVLLGVLEQRGAS